MPYYKNKNLLFIHIPRTGGTLIENQIKKICYESLFSTFPDSGNVNLQHLFYTTLYKFKNKLNINFDDIKIFSVVRNPYDRIISDLFWFRLIKKDFTAGQVYNVIKNNYLDRDYLDNHNKPQYKFITDENSELIKNIKIFNTETLNESNDELSKFLGFNINIEQKGVNKDYSRYLNKKSISLINNFYKKDFELLNYKFESAFGIYFIDVISNVCEKSVSNINMEIKDIRIFLSNYLNQEIIYIPNPGNAGDSLIAFGTIQIFNELGLNWKMGSFNDEYHNKTLFFAGGGNLVGLYKNCKKFIEKNKNDNKIIILPHTIKSEDKFLSSLNDDIIIFCREKTSYNYVLKVFKHKKNVYLSKDMAFYIKNLDKYNIIKGNGVCNAYRMDIEKTNINIPEDNVDLSHTLIKTDNTKKINIIKDVSLSIFDYLSKFETINTNRLHIAIAGSLLDKNVNFYRNSYYKNKSVFEYSINNIYKNTIFHN